MMGRWGDGEEGEDGEEGGEGEDNYSSFLTPNS